MLSESSIHTICEKYPFLIPRDIDGNVDKNFEYDSLRLEIPDGWINLFLQMCGDIKPILEREGVINDFYFLQVKEKYNHMRCYANRIVSRRVEEVIKKYEHMSEYVCSYCGCPATCKTDYNISFCDDCCGNGRCSPIERKLYFEVNTLSEGVHFDTKLISFSDEWNRYVSKYCFPSYVPKMYKIKLKCLHCGYEFDGSIEKDELGWHSSCPECECSFDVD